MHLTALRNNSVWSTLKGSWKIAGSVCGMISQRGDSSVWATFRGEALCLFLVENGIAVARETHDNLMIAATLSMAAARFSNAVVSSGSLWFLVFDDEGNGTLVAYDGEALTKVAVADLQWPPIHVPPVLEVVGDVFFVCPASVHLSAHQSSMMHHGVVAKSGKLIVPPTPVAPSAPAHSIFCQTPKFTITTNGTLAIVNGDSFDLRSLLKPVEAPCVSSGATFDTEIQVGFELDDVLPTIIGGAVACVAPDGFTRQSDIIGVSQTSNSLWLRLGRPLAVPEHGMLKIYGGFGADPAPYQYQSGPQAGKWAPRGIVARAAWVSVGEHLCVAVGRPGEVALVQIKGRHVVGAKRLENCDPATLQLVYDGEVAHLLDTQDRWGREHRLYPVAGAPVGVTRP